MQEKISGVKQAAFSADELLKALAIVNIFETSRPFGDFSACVVLNDGAGISYGINQFTHRSGALASVVKRYLELGGTLGRNVLENALANLLRNERLVVDAYAKNESFKKILRAAAITKEMRLAQMQIAFEKYLGPAMDECDQLGFVLPLSLAVVYDSLTHGSYHRFRDRIPLTHEKAWITAYVRERDRWLLSVPRLRSTRYRTQFFLDQIKLGRWELRLPLNVHGFWLRDEHIQSLLKFADEAIGIDPAVRPNLEPHTQSDPKNVPPTSSDVLTPTPQAEPPGGLTVREGSSTHDRALPHGQASAEACTPKALDVLEGGVNCASERFDQIDRIVTGVTIRTDRAKSLWTTVIGTIWQSAWAVFGLIAGLPREVWLVVAVIAALLMLLYLYRQIALGRMRERGHSCPHEPEGRTHYSNARAFVGTRVSPLRKI